MYSNPVPASEPGAPMAPAPAVPARKRRRPAVVCVQCRRRKVGCDRKKPCAQCIQYKSICTYERGSEPVAPPTRTPADNDSHSTTSSSVVQTTVSAPIGGLSSRTGTAGDRESTSGWFGRHSVHAPSPEDVGTPGSVRVQGRQGQSGLALRPPPAKDGSQRGPSDGKGLRTSGLGPATPGSTLLATQVDSRSPEPFQGRARFEKSRFFGQTHIATSIAPFEKIVRSSFHVVYDKGSEANVLLQKCKQAARAIKAKRPNPQSLLTDLRSYVPPRDRCDDLVDCYLRTFEAVFRVLHIPTFQLQYSRYWEEPEVADEVFVVKLLLVMSIGSVFRRELNDTGSFYLLEPWQWLNAAQLWLGGPYEKCRLGLDGIQIQCLILLSLQCNGVGADLTFITAGSLLRAAMTIGLHRDPRNFPSMSVLESEMRRRLWATIMEITLQSSVDLGMPPLISSEDFDCEPPCNLNDEQFDAITKVAPTGEAIDTYTQTSALCALSRTQSTRLRIVRALNSINSDLPYDEAVRLGQELTSACRSNSTLFEYFVVKMQFGTVKPSPFQIKLVDMLIRRFILSLHVPFAHRTDVSLAYYFSRKVCLESSLLLLSYSVRPGASDVTSREDDYSRLEIFGRGLFKMIFLLSAATVFYELTQDLQEDSSPSTSSLSRSDLIQSACNIVDLSWRRILAGETSVIGYIFFTCGLSHIKGLQSGDRVPPDYGVVASTKLQECYKVLSREAARCASLDTAQSFDWQGDQTQAEGEGLASGSHINPSFTEADLQLDTSTPWTFYGWGTWDTDDMLTSP